MASRRVREAKRPLYPASWQAIGYLHPQAVTKKRIPVVVLQLLLVLLTTTATADAITSAAERQVQERVRENVDHFMNAPVLATSLQAEFFQLGGFPHQLQAPDRNLALQYMYSQVKTRALKVYYGMETGVFLGYGDDFSSATNREPGESGYIVINATDDSGIDTTANATSQMYWNTCVNRETGDEEECQMNVGDKYIACQNNCELIPCATGSNKWCRNYAIETTAEGETRGYVPRTYHCINASGQFTQTPGQALEVNDDDDEDRSISVGLGDCTFGDGSLVTREISGPFAYCGATDGGNGEGNEGNNICNTTYTGMYRSRDYDPRYRSWYMAAAEAQHQQWSDPYPFFSTGDIGITWADPIYTTNQETGQQVFEGILAVDYPLDAISAFLIDAYRDTETLVVIFEANEPNYVVGVSTGSSTTKKVLASDPTVACQDSSDQDCEVLRLSISELQETDDDFVFQNAFVSLLDDGFPEDSFISVTVDEDIESDGYYSAISIIYEHPNTNLKWRIVVANPLQRNGANTITKGQPLFIPMCMVGGLGFTACAFLFVLFYRRRRERAVIYSDVRFTSAFIVGCALLNLTTFTLLGENTDELCMARMWCFHFMFALALSPLFVKVYRLWKLVGHATALRRPKITNLQAALYTVPIPALQGVILLVTSLVDPNLQTENMILDGGTLVPNVTCEHKSDGFVITQLVFDASLLCIGCLLAFVSRNMDPKFGEPKQMIFSMYNIAFTGVIMIALFLAVDIEEDGKRMLQAIGVFWGTVFSSAAFVVPRLMQANNAANQQRPVSRLGSTQISGLNLDGGGPTFNTELSSDLRQNDAPQTQEAEERSPPLK